MTGFSVCTFYRKVREDINDFNLFHIIKVPDRKKRSADKFKIFDGYNLVHSK